MCHRLPANASCALQCTKKGHVVNMSLCCNEDCPKPPLRASREKGDMIDSHIIDGWPGTRSLAFGINTADQGHNTTKP